MYATKKEEKIMWDIYVDLFKEATPSADFNKLVENAPIDDKGIKDIDFMDYEIEESVFDKILDKHLKGRRITKLKQRMFRNTILMGCSPKFKKYEL
jgi:glucuronate isomerase